MSEEKKMNAMIPPEDWEMSEAYYSEQGNKELSLEDFIEEQEIDGENSFASSNLDGLNRTAEDVERILKLAQSGKNSMQISQELGLTQEYIEEIQICAQSFPEDSPLAIARLLVFG